MRIVGIFAAALLSFAALHAHADTKAWTAAKANLPADAKILVGVDLAALQKTQLFSTLYAKMVEKADVTKVFDTVKSTCKVDPVTAVQGLVMAQSGDQEDGAVYLALSGIDRTKLSSCLTAAIQGAAEDKTAKVSVKQDGNVTQITMDGKDPKFVGWIGKDVVVVPVHGRDKASVVKWMAGKGALGKTSVARLIAKLNTSAPVWAAADASKEIESGVTAKGAYGTVTFAKGNVDADVHAVMESAAQATTMASSAQKQLDDFKGQLPPPFGGMLKTVTIAPASDEVILKGSFVEKDLLAALALALGSS